MCKLSLNLKFMFSLLNLHACIASWTPPFAAKHCLHNVSATVCCSWLANQGLSCLNKMANYGLLWGIVGRYEDGHTLSKFIHVNRKPWFGYTSVKYNTSNLQRRLKFALPLKFIGIKIMLLFIMVFIFIWIPHIWYSYYLFIMVFVYHLLSKTQNNLYRQAENKLILLRFLQILFHEIYHRKLHFTRYLFSQCIHHPDSCTF